MNKWICLGSVLVRCWPHVTYRNPRRDQRP